MSQENEEIVLLERVLLRLGNADTDDKLESTVARFLAPVILKMSSENETVRQKVFEVLTHISKRLKSRPQIQVPVAALLEQYATANNCAYLQNFDLIFINMGFPRLPVAERSALISKVLLAEQNNMQVQIRLIMLLLPLFNEMKFPEDTDKRKDMFELNNVPSTKRQFLQTLQDVLLLPYGVTIEQDVPAGLSAENFKVLMEFSWKAEDLETYKKGIVRVLCAGIFTDLEVFPLLVVGSADTRFGVATPAIAEVSKICTTLDFSDPKVTVPLFQLFTGSGNTANIKPENAQTATCARVRQKLMVYLLRCRGRGMHPTKGLQVMFEGLFGQNTNQKCKVLALQFADILIKESPVVFIEKICKVLLTGISKVCGRECTEPNDVQNAAYVALAQLARVCPSVVRDDLKLILVGFNHLANASADLQTSIRDALVAMAEAFAWNKEEIKRHISAEDDNKAMQAEVNLTSQQNLLLAMLSDNAEAKLHVVQNAASVFLTTCYPEYYAPTRYLLLLIAGERNTLRENVTSYLYGVTRKEQINHQYLSCIEHIHENNAEEKQLLGDQRHIIFPAFKTMMRYVHEMVKKRFDKGSSIIIVGRTKLPFSLEIYEEVLDYLRFCLWFSAGAKCIPGDEKYVQLVRQYILMNYKADDEEDNELHMYLKFVQRGIEAKRTESSLLAMYDLVNAAPELLASSQMHLLDALESSLRDVSETMRMHVAQLYGILLAYGCSDSDFNDRISKLLNDFPQKTLENKHGWLLVLGHGLSKKIEQANKTNDKTNKDYAAWKQFVESIKLIAKMLVETQWLLVSAAVKCVSMIGKHVIIPSVEVEVHLPADNDDDDDMSESKTATACTKLLIFGVIFNLLRSTSVRAKVREDAAKCLGYLAIGDGAYFTQRILDKFLSLAKVQKDATLNIAIAEAIASTLCGYDVNVGPTSNENDFNNKYCDDQTFDKFLNSLIRLVTEPNPHSRQSCAVWLLSLVKHCAKRPAVLKKRQILQYAFTELLSDDSEFVQDVASRGLGLVYALSDTNSQQDLANSLLEQLIGGKKKVNQVADDTELFAEGMLGKTPMGGNITTYKELCSLASDLNKPEMIYQFMQLANHNAAWTSKLGAAFGLKSLSKDSKEKMKPFLGKIVPRLYRYKYDPTPKIQNSMMTIWDSVVSDPKEAVEQYYWEILREILDNLTFNEWRVRIACCLAVRDLLKRTNGLRLRSEERKMQNMLANAARASAGSEAESKPSTSKAVDTEDVAMKLVGSLRLDEYTSEQAVPEPELKELWMQLFRVMDDIHEGTRLAAQGSAAFLSKLCVTAASSEHGKSGSAVAASILPFLLETGVTHTVADIRRVSIKTISEMIDSSGALIAPHLPSLIPCLLKATGELESTKLSYMSTRLGVDQEAQDAVDSIRAEAAKSQHTMDTINKCVHFADYAALEKMTPAILDIIRTSVNLGTKIACAHFICLISLRLGAEMTPLVSKYLGACFNSLKDRNITVRKYYASAIGHLVGIAKESSIKNLFVKLDQLYAENDCSRSVALTIQSVNRRQPELLKDYLESVFPLVFYAMHEQQTEDNKPNIELWKDLWHEITPGDAGIRMYLPVLMSKFQQAFEEDSWLRKTQAANAIATIAKRLGDSLPEAERLQLISLLLSGLQGRTFQGKESLLQALAALSGGMKNNQEMRERIIECAMRECRKKEPKYRTLALSALGDICEQLEVDRFEEVYNMLWYLLEKKDYNSVFGSDEEDNADEIEGGVVKSELNSDERNRRATVLNKLQEMVCVTLGKCWPKNAPQTQHKYQLQFAEKCAACLKNNTRIVQVSLMAALCKFLERLLVLDANAELPVAASQENTSQEKKLKVDNKESRDAIVSQICKDVLQAFSFAAAIPHTGLKKEALNVLIMLMKRLSDAKDTKHLDVLKQAWKENSALFQNDSAPEIRCRIRDIDEKLNRN